MTIWSLLGLIFFNSVIRKDHARNFGKAIIVWIALLAFIVITTMTWVERVNENRENIVINEIHNYYDGTADAEILSMDEDEFLEIQRKALHKADNTSVLIIMGLFGLALTVLLINYLSMQKWEKKAADERDQARTVAYTDPLTGVKSKHAFATEEGHIETKIIDGDIKDFGVIVCDVNGLKHINDTMGHKAGDDYIRAACKMLCEYFKHSPIFRIGGDEFVILLEGHDFETREDIMTDINKQIEANIGTDKVIISLGLAIFDSENDKSFHEVFKRADDLMYSRKMELKNLGAIVRE